MRPGAGRLSKSLWGSEWKGEFQNKNSLVGMGFQGWEMGRYSILNSALPVVHGWMRPTPGNQGQGDEGDAAAKNGVGQGEEAGAKWVGRMALGLAGRRQQKVGWVVQTCDGGNEVKLESKVKPQCVGWTNQSRLAFRGREVALPPNGSCFASTTSILLTTLATLSGQNVPRPPASVLPGSLQALPVQSTKTIHLAPNAPPQPRKADACTGPRGHTNGACHQEAKKHGAAEDTLPTAQGRATPAAASRRHPLRQQDGGDGGSEETAPPKKKTWPGPRPTVQSNLAAVRCHRWFQ